MTDRKGPITVAANLQNAAKQIKVALQKLAVESEPQHATTKQLQGVVKTLLEIEAEQIKRAQG